MMTGGPHTLSEAHPFSCAGILAAGQQPKPKKAPKPEAPAATEEPPKPRRGRRRSAAAQETAEATAEAGTITAPEESAEATQASESDLSTAGEAPSVAEPPPAEKPKRRLGRRKKEE